MRTLLLVQFALAVTLAVGGCATTQSEASDLTIPGSPNMGVPYEGPGAADAAATDSVRIALGETAQVGAVPVRFVSVVEDSRCPPDVSCVWAGRARVQLVVGAETVVLAVPSGMEDPAMPSEATVEGLTVRVAALAGPGPSQPGTAVPMWVEVVAGRSPGR
ncbi:MAG TPA: hypothetical protein VGB53_01305 [Rubricoccaceae bacterium]|jgi:hypothetical protein